MDLAPSSFSFRRKPISFRKLQTAIIFFIAFSFYHRAVVKKDHYMIHNIIPFCDAAVAESAVL
jgi:hypothetical protein